MDNQLTNIGIVRESRNDENRTPLVPEHIKKYKESNPNINFIIQPSNNRCFSDEEYELCGAKINENLNECSIIFGVKEIDPNILINNRTYLFFSHTFKINKQQKNIEKKGPLLLDLCVPLFEVSICLVFSYLHCFSGAFPIRFTWQECRTTGL